MRNIIFLVSVLFLVGCSTVKVYELTPDLKLTSQSVDIDAPPSSYGIFWEAWYLTSVKNNIQLFRHIPNMMSEDVRITVRTVQPSSIAKTDMLHKNENDAMEEYEKNYKLSDWEKKNNAERGVTYVKRYVDFIGGLKCATRVESSNIAMGVGSKSYQTNCNYFDNQNGAKNIHFDYTYTYTHSNTKYDTDKSSSIYSAQTMQLQFKQDIKAIFDSLVIHDMDREKMSKEGLLYDKKYDVNTEEKIPNNTGM